MFNVKEATFILESAEMDLENTKGRIEYRQNSIAEDARRLGEDIEMKERLQGIVDKIKAAMEDAKENGDLDDE